jgi:ABC-2 type transport system permease protein
MLSIYLKEIRSYLGSLIAYVVIITFLIVMGLFTWIFGDSNILSFGYANLDPLFLLAPWVFIFLISAITMRFFSEEQRLGTLEILLTKPITEVQIILGKFFAAVTLVLFSILPTIVYFWSIYQLGLPKGNIDVGATLGSYIGLFFLGGCYVAIGIFASSITSNQIVAFVLSMLFCFLAYLGFDKLGSLNIFGGLDYFIQSLGIQYHYESISRGVIDSRDVIYFISFIGLFLSFTYFSLIRKK